MNNNDEIYLNDVVMEVERMEKKSEIQPSLQSKKIVNIDERKKKLKNIWKIAFSKKKVETWFLKCIMLLILLCKWQ